MPRILHAKQVFRRSIFFPNQSTSIDVPKGCLAVYVGQCEKKIFVIPISFLNEPLFQELLYKAEEEFGFNHPMGGLTIPCAEEMFLDLTSRLSNLWYGNQKRRFYNSFFVGRERDLNGKCTLLLREWLVENSYRFVHVLLSANWKQNSINVISLETQKC